MKQYIHLEKSRINNYSLQHHFSLVYKKIELTIFIILSLFFLISSKVNQDFTKKVSYIFVDISIPVINTASFPFNLMINLLTNFEELARAKKENEKLKIENEKLKENLIQTLNVSNENTELKEILKFVIPKSLNYKAANVIGKTHQIFSHRLFLESRKDSPLKDGSAVINQGSMIGRVINSIDNKAELLLLTDSNSRIPIIISESRNRGILAGTNSELMEINFLPKKHNIKVGDMVFTSSDGENLPPGLLVGIVKEVTDQNVYVQMTKDMVNVRSVMVLEY